MSEKVTRSGAVNFNMNNQNRAAFNWDTRGSWVEMVWIGKEIRGEALQCLQDN